ncbi:long-chain fatty acid--CoA ligase [Sphingobium sp.]|uniref:long-chain fatty acid--CoA ligase n=1 Tax=Sphingobium sp. TaxID=1912891 RepID=UPI0028BF0283|nr:long-chain fatty acid--CoA ligase [Sphingobium sp.]
MFGAMQDWPLRLGRLFDHVAREHGTREIVSYQADGGTWRSNWAEAVADARRFAQALERLGIRPGDRVATLATNHLRHLIAWFGTIGMGGVLHTINPRLFDDQLAYIANHAEDRVLLYDPAFAPLVERLKPRLASIEHYIPLDDAFNALLVAEDGDYRWVEGDERAPAMLCYTSGTTGNPKGVLYEHRSTLLHMMGQVQPDVFNFSARTVTFPITPMFHANAWGLPFAAASVGAKLVLSMVNDPSVLHRLMIEEAVTHSCAVPTIWLAMLQHIEREGGDFGKLAMISCGGSAAPRAMIAEYLDRNIQFAHLWGMTELSPIGTVCALPADWDERDREARLDFVTKQGRTPFGVELRVVDEGGRELPRDGRASGRLQVRGPWTVDRYFQDEKGVCTDPDGWFDTGDVAVLHPDGMLQLTDRAKDVIKSGGEWISSVDLENAAIGCAGVAEAAAIGVSHPKWDERPLLLVVRKVGSEVDEEEVRTYLSTKVAKWWLPDAILFVDTLPHTGTGKLLKTALREQYRDYKLPDT